MNATPGMKLSEVTGMEHDDTLTVHFRYGRSTGNGFEVRWLGVGSMAGRWLGMGIGGITPIPALNLRHYTVLDDAAASKPRRADGSTICDLVATDAEIAGDRPCAECDGHGVVPYVGSGTGDDHEECYACKGRG